MDSIITTSRLNIRNWREDDISSLIQMNQDEEVMKYFPSIMSEEASLHFFKRVQQHFTKNGFGLFVIEDVTSREFLGFTGFMIAEFESSFTPCVEIGWRFRKQFWGRGYATEAAKACLDYGFTKLKFEKVFSFTSIHNKKSEAVMQRIGMHKTGEFKHPKIAEDHRLCLHVNYIIHKSDYLL